MSNPIPTKFFDKLPVPMLVVELQAESLNHNIIYSNRAFNRVIGWSLEEIPDKEHWWQKAYPDIDYQKVVESLWELSMETTDLNNDSFVTITVNIMTKCLGVKRFKVNTELKSSLVDGYYVVTFEEVFELNEKSD